MRALFVPVLAALILAGSVLSYAEQDTPINLKQLVQNQIAQIKARSVKQENAPSAGQTVANGQAAPEVNKSGNENLLTENASSKENLNEKKPEESKTLLAENRSLQSKESKTGDGLFLKVFILLDLSLLAALFVYWRRRKLKIGMAEKAKFKKNITKLRSEGKFHRKAGSQPDELRKRLQMDPAAEIEDEALLLKHAKKLAVPAGELLLASRIRSLEKAHE